MHCHILAPLNQIPVTTEAQRAAHGWVQGEAHGPWQGYRYLHKQRYDLGKWGSVECVEMGCGMWDVGRQSTSRKRCLELIQRYT